MSWLNSSYQDSNVHIGWLGLEAQYRDYPNAWQLGPLVNLYIFGFYKNYSLSVTILKLESLHETVFIRELRLVLSELKSRTKIYYSIYKPLVTGIQCHKLCPSVSNILWYSKKKYYVGNYYNCRQNISKKKKVTKWIWYLLLVNF